MADVETYQSPLITRYAGKAMAGLFAPLARARAWREVWIALAEAERELGAPIEEEQVEALRETRDQIDLARVAEIEATTRHDVMAHIRAWAEVCPKGAPIIHLGATSAFVTDNAEATIIQEGLNLIRDRCVQLVRALTELASREAARPTLGYTHFQAAQPVTVGKRAALWLQDAVCDLEDVQERLDSFPCRGAKGTTGTQASFLELLGSEERVVQLDRLLAEKLGFPAAVALSGQTSPRKLEARLADSLAGIGITLGKLGRDARLLCHTGELREAFGAGQVGSSAMPYKRNPMRAERICALARLTLHYRDAIAQTAMAQWLERSLDDSAARRIAIPDLFLTTDGLLRAAIELVGGLRVDVETVNRRLAVEAPFMLVEKLLVRGVVAGGDRQQLHEALKEHALGAKTEASGPGFLERVAADERFGATLEELNQMSEPEQLVGRAPAQVQAFLKRVEALLSRYSAVPDADDPLKV